MHVLDELNLLILRMFEGTVSLNAAQMLVIEKRHDYYNWYLFHQDANTNKIKQWRGLQDASGVNTLHMVMDTQPVLGDWKITVSAYVS